MQLRRTPNWPLIGLLLLYLASSCFLITRFPKAWTDTSWMAVRGYTLVTEGRLATPMLRDLQHRDEHLLMPMVVQPVILGATYELFGFGLWQSRAPSILAGFLLVLLTYWFAREYYGRGVALLALTFLCFDNIFFVSSRVVRPDVLLALFSSASLFLFYHGLHKGALRHVALAGAAMGLAACTHPHALLIFAAILLLFLHRFGLSVLRARELWWFAAFAVLFFLPYAAYVVFQDGATGFAHLGEQLGDRPVYARRSFLGNLSLELDRYRDYIFFPKRILVFVVQVVAVAFGLFSKRSVDRQLSFVVIVAAVLFPILRPYNGNSLYLVILIPLLSILVASGCSRAWRWLAARRARASAGRSVRWGMPALAAVALLYALNGLIGNASILFLHRNCEFEPYFERIRALIPPGSRVLGQMDLWLGLHDHPYVTPSSPASTLVAFRPDYAVLYDRASGEQGTAITNRPRTRVPELFPGGGEAARVLSRERGAFVGRVADGCYGTVEVHALRWDP